MKIPNSNRSLLTFLGVTLFIQAVTSLVAGLMFLSPFDSNEITSETLKNIAANITNANISIVLQFITALVIIMLGVAMFVITGQQFRSLGTIALCMYILEAIMLVISQIFAFGLTQISQQFLTSGDTSLFISADSFLSLKEFSGKMAMLPFGIGAILFYYLLLKTKTIPKWLALYGLITVPFILVSMPLMAFGIDVPFYLCVPYVPFEFFTGLFLIIKNLRPKSAIET